MEHVEQKIIDRIAKMLRLAQNEGATEGERDNALRMAHATLAKYNLDISEIEESTGRKNAGEARTRHGQWFYGRTPWARQVAAQVARMLFCGYYYSPKRGEHYNVMHYFVGRHSNAVSAGLLADFVVKSIERESKARGRKSQDRYFAKEFALGASIQIKLRVDELLGADKPAPATPGTALVLASLYQTEGVENGKFLATLGVKLVTAAPRKIVRGGMDAHNEGRQYGASVSLNHQLS